MQESNEVVAHLHSLREAEARLRVLLGKEGAEALLLREVEVWAEKDREYRMEIEKIAHDLSNILAPVQMSAYLLRAHIGGEEGEEILSTLEVSVAQGLDLIRRALSVAREGKAQKAGQVR